MQKRVDYHFFKCLIRTLFYFHAAVSSSFQDNQPSLFVVFNFEGGFHPLNTNPSSHEKMLEYFSVLPTCVKY